MRTMIALTMVSLMLAAGMSQDSDEFVVHEWGTFTSFSGSDGIQLEFRPLIDEDLPKFMLDRPRQAGFLDQLQGYASKKRVKTRQTSRYR